MVKHLYPNFLRADREYSLSEEHWIRLWDQIDPQTRASHGWQHPWFEPLPRTLSEGNPIFTAVSQVLRRGIRVIQHEPTDSGLEIQAWLDFFGGNPSDPDRIEELVISCALSDLASDVASSLIESWVKDESFCCDEGDVSTLIARSRELTRSGST
jgi:hypothetical protein